MDDEDEDDVFGDDETVRQSPMEVVVDKMNEIENSTRIVDTIPNHVRIVDPIPLGFAIVTPIH